MITATERFIEDAIEGGWEVNGQTPELYGKRHAKVGMELLCPQEVLLIPDAWRAVGRTRGWMEECQHGRYGFIHEYQFNMHGLIDALCEGKSIEYYIKSIEV